jgi:hypothetical protein
MNSKKLTAIYDQAVEVAWAEVAKDSEAQPMDLYLTGLGFAVTGLVLVNLPGSFAGLQVIGTVLIAMGLVGMAAIKRKV